MIILVKRINLHDAGINLQAVYLQAAYFVCIFNHESCFVILSLQSEYPLVYNYPLVHFIFSASFFIPYTLRFLSDMAN